VFVLGRSAANLHARARLLRCDNGSVSRHRGFVRVYNTVQQLGEGRTLDRSEYMHGAFEVVTWDAALERCVETPMWLLQLGLSCRAPGELDLSVPRMSPFVCPIFAEKYVSECCPLQAFVLCGLQEQVWWQIGCVLFLLSWRSALRDGRLQRSAVDAKAITLRTRAQTKTKKT
jgi:hypothetical protein